MILVTQKERLQHSIICNKIGSDATKLLRMRMHLLINIELMRKLCSFGENGKVLEYV